MRGGGSVGEWEGEAKAGFAGAGANACAALSKRCGGLRRELNDIMGMNGQNSATLVAPHPIGPSRASATPATGAWRYQARKRTRLMLWSAMLVSATVHAIFLFGFNRKSPPKKQVMIDDSVAVNLVMPDLKELEEPEAEVFEGEETPVDTGLTVPMLADVPSQVDLSTAFIQEIDYSSLVPKQDLTAAKTLSIPTNINRGGKIGEGMGKIFDLKDLDRAPDPLVRIAPVVPVGMRQAGFTAEVVVAFIVDPEGKVVGAQVVSSTDHKLNEPALLAMAKWKFRPGIKNGRRVNVRMMQPLLFRVSED